MVRDPERVLNPPAGKPAEGYTVHTTCCQYCIVACGYEVHVFDADAASPQLEDLKGLWLSPSMTNKIRVDGKEKIAAVLPDPKCPVNKGNHSVRGGTMGRNLTLSQIDPSKERESTRERIKTPLIRLRDGTYMELTPEQAVELVASLIRVATKAEYT